MKHLIFLLSLFLCASQVATAQDFPPPPPGRGPGQEGGDRGQRMKALYVAYISDALKLSEEDAQKFWPLHAQFESELRSIDRNLNELDREQAALDIKKKYQDRFVRVLGNDRTDEFYKKDAEFRKKMVDRLKEMREKRQGGGGNPDKPNRKQGP